MIELARYLRTDHGAAFARYLFSSQGTEPPDIKPSEEGLARIAEQYRHLRIVATLGMARIARFTASGTEHIPETGPVVILTNHTALLDALHINYVAQRPVIFLASASIINDTLRGRFLHSMGMIPKRKFTPDARSIRTLRGWTDAGAAVGIFPEGERSWDGRPLPLVPGIGKLIRFLGAPVVTGRIHNGDRHWPRWAEHRRWGRVHAEFDPPVTFGRRDPVDEITRHITEAIHLPSHRSRRWSVHGPGLASGLANLLFLCPGCEALESLVESDDAIRCTQCGAAWRLNTAGYLVATRGSALSTHIAEQVPRIQATIEAGWVQDPRRFATDRVIVESKPGRLLDQSSAQARDLGAGQMVLTPEELRFAALRIPLTELRAVSIEERRRLWLMTADRILEPDLPGDSIVKWGWVIQHWRRRALAQHP